MKWINLILIAIVLLIQGCNRLTDTENTDIDITFQVVQLGVDQNISGVSVKWIYVLKFEDGDFQIIEKPVDSSTNDLGQITINGVGANDSFVFSKEGYYSSSCVLREGRTCLITYPFEEDNKGTFEPNEVVEVQDVITVPMIIN